MIIGAVRILGSLPVLRWAFVGAIIAILVDLSDLFMMGMLPGNGLPNYQSFDKWADLAYMITFLIVALRWSGTGRNVAIGLFLFRIIGVITFELSSLRQLLLFFPNVFEFWIVFVAGTKHFKPSYQVTPKRVALWLLPMLALKEFQEYILHWGQWLDKYVAVDLVVSWWRLLTGWF